MMMNPNNEEKALEDVQNALTQLKAKQGKVGEVFFRYRSTMSVLEHLGWTMDCRGGCDYFIWKNSDFK